MGYCNCRVDVYRSKNYGSRCSSKTVNVEKQWKPPRACRGDMNSIKISSGCKKVNIIDDDGSWHQQNKMITSSISDLPYDLEDDVAGFVMYPRKNCCVKNC